MIFRCLILLLLVSISCQQSDKRSSAATSKATHSNADAVKAWKKGQRVGDFLVDKLYLDELKQVRAVKLVHRQWSSNLYLMFFSSVYQGAFTIESIPTSDKGEPHVLEHVVLGKGSSGKQLAELYSREFGQHSATTHPRFTFYHFNVQTGLPAFLEAYRLNLKMFFHPEFTFRDIENETFHLAVDGEPGNYRLLEKGSAYLEMNTNHGMYDNWWGMLKKVYGDENRLTFQEGGSPAGLRALAAEDVMSFHKANYRLDSGFTSLVVIPPSQNAEDFLLKVSDIYQQTAAIAPEELKKPRAKVDLSLSPTKNIQPVMYEYASENDQSGSSANIAWEVQESTKLVDELRLELFLMSFAQGSQSPLSLRLNEQQKSNPSFPARGIWLGSSEDYIGKLVYGVFTGIATVGLDHKKLNSMRKWLVSELNTVASWKDHSPQLLQFNERVQSFISSRLRQQTLLFEAPPQYGGRDTRPVWFELFQLFNRNKDFEVIVSLREQLLQLKKETESGKNIWKNSIAQFGLLDVPYILSRSPSTEKLQRVEKQREFRLTSALQRIRSQLKEPDTQRALQIFKDRMDEADQKTEVVKASEQLSENPPMELDDSIPYEQTKLWGKVPLLLSTFPQTHQIVFGLSSSLQVFRPDEYIYLPLLIDLLDKVGLYDEKTNQAISPALFNQMMQKETGGIGFGASAGHFSQRYDFSLSVHATNKTELQSGFDLARRMLRFANFSPGNLPLIRRIVDKSLNGLIDFRESAPENWLTSLAQSYFYQTDRLLLHLNSEIVQLHDYRRYRWWLKEPPNEFEAKGIDQAITKIDTLLKEVADKSDLKEKLLVLDLPESANQLRYDLLEMLPEFSGQFKTEVAETLRGLVADWKVSPVTVLNKLTDMRQRLLSRYQTSAYLMVNATRKKEFLSWLETQSDFLPAASRIKVFKLKPKRSVEENIKKRNPAWTGSYPQMIGFVNPGSSGHVLVESNGRPLGKKQADDYFRALAVGLMGGEGSHSAFMKTWQKGLAYNNSISYSINSGRVNYYAEQSPNLISTLNFVKDILLTADVKALSNQLNYSLVQYFNSDRKLRSPAARTYSLYNDFREQRPPQKIRKFRNNLMVFSRRSDIQNHVEKAYDKAVKSVIFDSKFRSHQREQQSQFFFVAPESQLQALDQAYGVEGFSIQRVYAIDFRIQ